MADETVFLAPCAISSFQFQIQLTVAYKFFLFETGIILASY